MSGYWCSNCRDEISLAELRYSQDHFGRILCRGCQKSVKSERPNPRFDVAAHQTESTPETIKLFEALRKEGVDVRTRDLEKFDGFKHIDITIPSAMLNIEVDGIHHNTTSKQAMADLKRSYFSFKKGWLTLHIPNILTKDENLRETARFIAKIIKESENQLDEEDKY